MRIAAIDYGLHCGLAIGTLVEGQPTVNIRKLKLMTIFDDLNELRSILKMFGPNSVVLEACPYRAPGQSLHIYEHTHAMLVDQLGYQDGNNIFSFNELVTIGPGLWKPFVKKQDLPYYLWNPNTKHEKDAMSLLWYALRISTEKEVKYV